MYVLFKEQNAIYYLYICFNGFLLINLMVFELEQEIRKTKIIKTKLSSIHHFIQYNKFKIYIFLIKKQSKILIEF